MKYLLIILFTLTAFCTPDWVQQFQSGNYMNMTKQGRNRIFRIVASTCSKAKEQIATNILSYYGGNLPYPYYESNRYERKGKCGLVYIVDEYRKKKQRKFISAHIYYLEFWMFSYKTQNTTKCRHWFGNMSNLEYANDSIKWMKLNKKRKIKYKDYNRCINNAKLLLNNEIKYCNQFIVEMKKIDCHL